MNAPLPERAVIDVHIPSGYKIRGFTKEQLLEYAKAYAAEETQRLTAALQERDAEIETLKAEVDLYRSACDRRDAAIAAQRKVLEQVKAVLLDVAESINLKRVWKDSDGQRMDEAVDAAITAIQGVLK